MKPGRITFTPDDVLDAALANLKGQPLRGLVLAGEKFGESWNPHENARQRRLIFEEAVYALEDFAAAHGYVPRMPRFEVVMDANGMPARARRHDRCLEMNAIDAALKRATLHQPEEEL